MDRLLQECDAMIAAALREQADCSPVVSQNRFPSTPMTEDESGSWKAASA